MRIRDLQVSQWRREAEDRRLTRAGRAAILEAAATRDRELEELHEKQIRAMPLDLSDVDAVERWVEGGKRLADEIHARFYRAESEARAASKRRPC